MISIEAYRSCIGSFAYTAQRNLKSIAKSLFIGSFLSSHGLSRILKPAPFVALFVFLTFAFPKSQSLDKPKIVKTCTLTFVFAFKNNHIEYPYDFLHKLFLSYLKINFTLLLSGDVELNPGPPSKQVENSSFEILYSIQGNFNQRDARFGEFSGTQCSCMAIASICMTKIRKPTIWKELDLDFILTHGDNLFKTTGKKRPLYFDELPEVFEINNNYFQIEYPRTDDNFISDENECSQFVDEDYLFSNSISGAIIFFNDYCISIIKDKDSSLFVFDSHSRDQNGQPVPEEEGKSILMRFRTVESIRYYMIKTYKKITHFQIVFVKINEITEEQKNIFMKIFQKFKRQIQYKVNAEKRKTDSKSNYEKNSKRRKQNFKDNYALNMEERKEISKVNYLHNVKKRKQNF